MSFEGDLSSGERRGGDVGQIPLIDFREMEWVKHIACGGMAEISLYKWSRPGLQQILVAKKSLFRGSVSGRYKNQLRSEMDILARLEHKNIVKTFGVVETGHDFGLLMEFLELGSYRKFFAAIWENIDRTPALEQTMMPLKIRILDEIIDAMTYLHGIRPQKILHLDLKSENVLLENQLHAKICDFGLSKMSTLTTLRNSTTVEIGRASGTPGYISPERLRNISAKPTTKSDVYSFGILQWEILTDRIPYEGIDNNDFRLFAYHILNENLRPQEDRVSEIITETVPELVEMMKRAWSKDPNDRPSFEDLHQELNGIKNRMTRFSGDATDSAEKTLTLWRSVVAATSGTANTASSELPNRYSGIASSAHLALSAGECSTASQKQATSMPSTTKSKQGWNKAYPNLSLTEDDKLESMKKKNLLSDDFFGETVPLIPKYVVKKKFLSPTKTLAVIVAFLIGCTVVGVIAWVGKTHSSSTNSGCPDHSPPAHGHMSCTKKSRTVQEKCTFVCDKGYGIHGSNPVTCNDGKWSDEPPVCDPVCPDLHPVTYGKYSCTNDYFVNSTCNFACTDKHNIRGHKTTTCQSNRRWSHPEPNCTCPPCLVGDKCQYSIAWKDVEHALDPMVAFGIIKVNYGEETFTCSTQATILIKFTALCSDTKTGTSRTCSNKQVSARGAAQHAAAQLIRDMEAKKLYPEPCDAKDMPTVC